MSHRCQSTLAARNGQPQADVAGVSADFKDGHLIAEHSHPENQLLFASAGVMTLRTRKEVWVVPPLRALWIPADTYHSVAICGHVSMRTLYLRPKLCTAIPQRCFVINVSALLRELILHACQLSRLRRRVEADRPVVQILIDLLKAAEYVPLQLPHPADVRALRVVRALSADPGDQRTLEALCKDCGAAKRTIQRLFLEETRMSFHRWRQQLRLLHGLQLLARGEKVTVAALESGYCSTSAFISVFRKQLGATPTRYLRNGIARDGVRRS